MYSSPMTILLPHGNHVFRNSYYGLEIKAALTRVKIKGTLTMYYPGCGLYAPVERSLRKLISGHYLAIYTLLVLS
jgi:hypothetical protein